jgi:hypothetical protein
MIQNLTIDIIKEKAVKLIQDMELLKLIRIRKEKAYQEKTLNRAAKYKGAMQKQQLNEVDDQLNELRKSWE